MDQGSNLTGITDAWQSHMRPAIVRAAWSVWLAVAVAAMLLARQGTLGARGTAVVLLTVAALSVAWVYLAQRRRMRMALKYAVAIVRKVSRSSSDELARAIELVEHTRSRVPSVSIELAELHLQRVTARVPVTAISEKATVRAGRLRQTATVLVVASLGYVVFARATLFEGLNVLLAWHGRAPFGMQFVELEAVTAQPPSYLQESPSVLEFDSSFSVRRGSLIVVRGTARHAVQRLILTDGANEVPFVSDGKGGLFARYRLGNSVRLGIAARFGNVLVRQNADLTLEAVPDPVPVVELQGAPKHVSWSDVSEIELSYRCSDDHGIRQIDLVLRAATREERRVLARLDGTTRFHVGAHVLNSSDPFVMNSYGSVEVFIAARDDNSYDNGGWGQSAIVTMDKASLGGAQVRRREAYLRLREELVDWLAALRAKPRHPAEVTAQMARVLARLEEIDAQFAKDATERKVMRPFLRAQRDKLRRAASDAAKLPAVVDEVALSVDVAIEAVAQRDAEHVARLLADVAVEIELGAKAATLLERDDEGIRRMKAARGVLQSGARELERLGILGADLGEIALAGGVRIGRAYDGHDWQNVGRAASFLAERLRRPQPSFKGGGRVGVESGGVRSGHSKTRASEADVHLERVIAELFQLARDHAAEVGSVERVVGDAEQGLGTDDMRPMAVQRARELRRIVERLPPLGAEAGSARAALALAKELVTGVAGQLERLQLPAAHEGLGKADSALLEAEMLEEAPESEFGPKALRAMRKELAGHRRWVKDMLERARANVSEELGKQLRQAARREREIGERARGLAERESKQDAVLPDEVRADLEQASRLMQRAAESLDSGQGANALERQRQAQNLLERSQPEPRQERAESQHEEGKDERNGTIDRSVHGGSVVPTGDVENREKFRRRVQEGLSKEVTPEISKAVRRYAEGLLK